MRFGIAQSEIDYQYRDDADCAVGFAIEPNAELNFTDASAWEYPVQNGSDLLISQVGFMKLHQHKLEVK